MQPTDSYYECNTCGERLAAEFFYADNRPNTRSPIRPRCKMCTRAAARKQCPERRREARLLREYGLTGEDYEEMHSSQGGRCAICRNYRRLVVDHCHTSGNVRGLLCSRCNVGLGHFRDDVARLAGAISYLYPNNSNETTN